MNSEHIETYSPEDIPTVEYTDTVAEEKDGLTDQVGLRTGNRTYTLEQLAYTRSGDKGNHANIGSSYVVVLTLPRTTNFRLFQTQSVCRRQLQT